MEIARILSGSEFGQLLRRRLPRECDVGELLGRTWERAQGGVPDGNPIRWLLKIAINLARDDAKAERRRKYYEARRFVDLSYVVNLTAALQCSELRKALRQAVRAANLPRNQYLAFRAWLQGRLAEWAAQNGIPLSTARVWAHRAREALRPHMIRAGYGLD